MPKHQATSISQGQRIIKLRRITHLSRRAFGEKHGISPGTLQNWEMDRYRALTKKAASDLIAAFQLEGINCSVEWLLYGTGPEPSYRSLNKLFSTDKNPANDLLINLAKKNAEHVRMNEKLYQATKAGRYVTVEKLIEAGADLHLYEGFFVHPYDNDENTPLHISAFNGHLDLVKLLIKKGSKVSFRNRKKQTPLHLAVDNGHIDVIDYLVQQGADMNAVENEGDAAISWAAYAGQTNIVQHLINLGASVTGKNHINNTPLHWAAYKGHTDIVELLINSSASPNEKNSYGETAIDCAVKTGQVETVLFLLSYKK